VEICEYGVYDIPIKLQNPLNHNQELFRDYVIKAQKRLKLFSEKNNWIKHIENSFANTFEIYDDKKEFDKRLKQIFKIKDCVEIPDTYCAFLENKILVAVNPELYEKVFPEGIEEDSYEKLLCHEMAHQFHIRILDGNENAMGPVWFYEGFAIYVSNQFSNIVSNIKENEILEIINNKERGSYRKYSEVIRHVLNKIPLPSLVRKAGNNNFNDWVIERI
jgi:hypothetical protein